MVNPKILYTLLLLSSTTLFSQEIFTKHDFSKNQDGFHGNVGLTFIGASFSGYTDYGDFDNKTDFQFYPSPLINADLGYTVDEFSVYSEIAIEKGLGIGLRFDMFDLYYIPKQTRILKRFIDPLDKKSKRTTSDIETLEFSINNILETPFSFHYEYHEESLANDQHGISQNLSAQNRSLLQRSFKSDTLGLSYEDTLDETTLFYGKVHFVDNKAKGDANSYQAYNMQTGIVSSYKTLFYGLDLNYEQADYKKKNPIQQVVEQRKNYGANIYAGYKISSSLSSFIAYNMQNVDSNINLYDQKMRFVSTGLNYEF